MLAFSFLTDSHNILLSHKNDWLLVKHDRTLTYFQFNIMYWQAITSLVRPSHSDLAPKFTKLTVADFIWYSICKWIGTAFASAKLQRFISYSFKGIRSSLLEIFHQESNSMKLGKLSKSCVLAFTKCLLHYWHETGYTQQKIQSFLVSEMAQEKLEQNTAERCDMDEFQVMG